MASNSSSMPTDIERVGYGKSLLATGLHREVIAEAVATRTLLAEESGALCAFDVATGVVYTLPTAVKGMQFSFVTTVSRTSTNAYKVITSGGAFLLGAYAALDPNIATSGDVFTGDGSTHIAIILDADTEGGIIGGKLNFTALSSTIWYVEGFVVGTGTMATGFSTT